MKAVRKKLLFISHSSGRYGAEKSLLTLLEGLKEGGRYEIAVLLPNRGPLVEELQAKNIELHITPYATWMGETPGLIATLHRIQMMGVLLLGIARSLAWVRNWNPDLIYSNSTACLFGMMLARCLRKPHIWHVRELIRGDVGIFDPGSRLFMRLANQSTGKMICISEAVARRLAAQVPSEKISIVYNGFDFSARLYPDAGERYERTVEHASRIRLAIIGSIHPIKGQEDGIRALAILKRKGVPAILDIIGDGERRYMRQLGKLVEDLSLADSVRFCGYVTDIAREHAELAALLVPSRWDAFGRVAVESQSYGTPVISSTAGGLPEIIRDRFTGLHYPPGDPAALAEQILTLLNDRALYERCIRQGWQEATHRFNKSRYVEEVSEVIEDALFRAVSDQ